MTVESPKLHYLTKML